MHTEVDEEADKMLTAQTERDQLYSTCLQYLPTQTGSRMVTTRTISCNK